MMSYLKLIFTPFAMLLLKGVLTWIMGGAIVVLIYADREIAEDGLRAGLFAFMAAATFLVGQLPARGQTWAWVLINPWNQLFAGAAAVMSAVNWMSSESDGEDHILVVALAWMTTIVVMLVTIILAFLSLIGQRAQAQHDADPGSE